MKRRKIFAFACRVSEYDKNIKCEKTFQKTERRDQHMLFEHFILLPKCSTGIAEKTYAMKELEFRRKREILAVIERERLEGRLITLIIRVLDHSLLSILLIQEKIGKE